jgi:hypothetical protein
LLRNLNKLCAGDIVQPYLSAATSIAGVLVHENAASTIYFHVIQHAVTLISLEQDIYLASFFGKLHIVEAQAPEATVGR